MTKTSTLFYSLHGIASKTCCSLVSAEEFQFNSELMVQQYMKSMEEDIDQSVVDRLLKFAQEI